MDDVFLSHSVAKIQLINDISRMKKSILSEIGEMN